MLTGAVAGIKIVSPEDDAILITSEGVIIRMDTEEISTYGRVTKGVRLMRLADGISVVTVARVEKEDEVELAEELAAEETAGTDSAETAE